MREVIPLVLAIAFLLVLGCGCGGGPRGTSTGSRALHPGYGEFNAENVLIGNGKAMGPRYLLTVPSNRTVTLHGIVFPKEYGISSANGSTTTGYYGGKVRLKAYLADALVSYAWSSLEQRLKPVSGLEVRITPGTVEVGPGKNGTFEVRIDTSGATPGKTYYLYIVASGVGWRGWAIVEVSVEKAENA